MDVLFYCFVSKHQMRSSFLLILCSLIKYVHSHEEKDCNLHGISGDGYYLAAEIGLPPQKFNLLVDTGSSNLAIVGASYPGAKLFYNQTKSKSYIHVGASVKVIYTQGWWEGILGKDLVRIPSLPTLGTVITDLSIMSHAEGVYMNSSHWQGILGLAYEEIAQPHGIATPWFDSLNNVTPNETRNRFSLELCGPGSSKKGFHNGWFSVGNVGRGCPESEFSTPIHHHWFYEVVISGIDINGERLDIACSSYNAPQAIIDSGTTNLQLPAKTFKILIEKMRSKIETGDVQFTDEFWEGKKDVCFSDRTLPWFPHLTIYLDRGDGSPFGIDVPPQSYLRPSLNASDSPNFCFVLGIEVSHIGTVLGAVLLEGLCTTFDRKNDRIFFANSSCGPNFILVPSETSEEVGSCSYAPDVVNGSFITAMVILVVVLLPLALALLRCLWRKFSSDRKRLPPGGTVPFITLSESDT